GHVGSGGGGDPVRIKHHAPALPVIQAVTIRHDLVNVTALHRADHVQAIIQEASAAGDGQVPVLAVHALGDTGGDTGLEAFELTIQNEVDDTGQGVRAIGRGGPARDHVDLA